MNGLTREFPLSDIDEQPIVITKRKTTQNKIGIFLLLLLP